jgi:hypothetical protein
VGGHVVKKALLIGGIVAAVLLAGCAGVVGVFIWLFRSGAASQDRFFTAVDSGDVQQLTALFHPALRQEVDEPVLAAWVTAVRKNLGKYQGLSPTDFHTNISVQNGAKTVEGKGTVRFEKGTAQAEIRYQDDQIVQFKVESPQLPADWFAGPEGTELYRKRGEKYLEHLLGDQLDAAYQMEHEALRQAMPRDRLARQMEELHQKAGKFVSVSYKSEHFVAKPNHQVLSVYYTAKCEKVEAPAKVDFQFVGLKGHIIAFAVGDKARE